ncbi:hypothetical protein ACFPMF_15595 [Larkinella bovis]|uniref:Uncharacterized protein n=1 Tax=Larkinella bovis TaxID=683041 RepID=A0ABW0IED2_9BACT
MTHENPKKTPGGQQVLANRHLKEWKAQVAFETKSRYTLANQHQHERTRLSMEGSGSEQLAELKAQQMRQLQFRKLQNNQTRQALQTRHLKEKAEFNPDIGMNGATASRGSSSH